MDKSMTMKIAAIAVVIVVIAAACVVFINNSGSDKTDAEINSPLMVRGNADNNYKIDSNDMKIVEDVISGSKSLKDYPLADVNNDGAVNDTDKQILQDMLDHKSGITVYVQSLDRDGKETTVPVQYPLRNVVTYATNMEMPTLYAGGGEYVAGYFTKSYDSAQASVASTARDLEGSQRQISDASWANFTKLDSDIQSSGGIGAFLVDYSGIAQITESRYSDLQAAGIPMLCYKSADASVESSTVITLSYLFGEKTEKTGAQYAELTDKVKSEIDKKLGNLSESEKKSYIAFTMHIYICGSESTFASTGQSAYGKYYTEVNADFKAKYDGDGSTKMEAVEALSNYTDVDVLINNRSIDWVADADAANKIVVSTWEHSNKGVPSTEYFKGFEDKLVYVNNLLPGPAKLAYMAAALYGEHFTYEWANGILQECIDMGLTPLKGYTIEQVVPYFDNTTYKAAKS